MHTGAGCQRRARAARLHITPHTRRPLTRPASWRAHERCIVIQQRALRCRIIGAAARDAGGDWWGQAARAPSVEGGQGRLEKGVTGRGSAVQRGAVRWDQGEASQAGRSCLPSTAQCGDGGTAAARSPPDKARRPPSIHLARTSDTRSRMAIALRAMAAVSAQLQGSSRCNTPNSPCAGFPSPSGVYRRRREVLGPPTYRMGAADEPWRCPVSAAAAPAAQRISYTLQY